MGVINAIPSIRRTAKQSPSDPITFAVNASGPGTRYDATDDTELAMVPYGTIGEGDAINIFYKDSPYRTKIGFRGQGTVINKIIINGVTDQYGRRPVLDADGAETAATCNPGPPNNIFSATPEFGEALGPLVVIRGQSDDYFTYIPEHIEIRNLEIKGLNPGKCFTALTGPATYGDGAGLWLQNAKDVVIENCVIHDNAFGIFTMAKDGLLSQACQNITLRNCKFYWNGVQREFFQHSVYMQASNPIVEGCYIGKNREGSQGSAYKSRSSNEIFRYNYIEASLRACDWVHSEGQGIDGIGTLPDYPETYAYGNVILSDGTLGGAGNATFPIHFGGDNLGEDGPQGTPYVSPSEPYKEFLYFWGNTVVLRLDTFSCSLFDLSLAVGNPVISAPSEANAWDNIFVITPISGSITEPAWQQFAGVLNLEGNNLTFGSTPFITGTSSGATPFDPTYIDRNENGTILSSDPNFEDINEQNYTLTVGSGAINQRTNPAILPVSLQTIMTNHPINGQPIFKDSGIVNRPTLTSLGALEYGLAHGDL